MEMLDFAVTANPLTLFENHIDWRKIVPSTQLEEHKGNKIIFCVWLVTSRRVHTKKDQYMKFLTLEDYFGLCEIVLFPKVYAEFGHLIRTHGPYIITGNVQSRLPGEANLIAEKVELVIMNKKETEALLQKITPPTWSG